MIAAAWQKWRWDGLGMGLAGLCLVHCLATSILLALAATAGGMLGNPAIHEIGLFFAIMFGAVALFKGVMHHGYILPASVGGLGMGLMAGALSLPHGDSGEIMFTMLGVTLLAFGHDLNYRAGH